MLVEEQLFSTLFCLICGHVLYLLHTGQNPAMKTTLATPRFLSLEATVLQLMKTAVKCSKILCYR